MTHSHSPRADEIVRQAKAGDPYAIAELLETYRNYVSLLARVQLDTNMHAKVNPSDLVQETFLHATRDFAQFRGVTEAEFVAWLRRILANAGAAMTRRFKGTQCRDIARERQLEDQLHQSSLALGMLVSREPTPSQIASRREDAVVLADALQRLPGNYREVLVLHHLEGIPIGEVAERLDITLAAAKGLRSRATMKLRGLLKDPKP